MATYTEQEKKQLHSISIIEIMAHYGKRLDHTLVDYTFLRSVMMKN